VGGGGGGRGKPAGHAGGGVRRERRGARRIARATELERPGPHGGLSVGHDPHPDARAEPPRGGGPHARRAGRDTAASVAVPRRVRLPGYRLTRALLTGATGFVGANLARRLLQDGVEGECRVPPG